jgi:hypothetical protein
MSRAIAKPLAYVAAIHCTGPYLRRVRRPLRPGVISPAAAGRSRCSPAVPAARVVGVLLNAASPITGAQQLAPIKHAALALDIELVIGEAQSRDSIPAAIDALLRRGISALIVVGDAMFFNERKVMVDLAWNNRLPAIYPEREYAEAGGLMSYGQTCPTISGAQRVMSLAFSKGKSPAICRSCSRPSLSWSSTSRPRRRSVSTCLGFCNSARTR